VRQKTGNNTGFDYLRRSKRRATALTHGSSQCYTRHARLPAAHERSAANQREHMPKLKALLPLMVLALMIGGCGGGGHSPLTQSMGSASLVIKWPDGSPATLSAESIRIVISNGTTTVASRVLDRATVEDQTAAVFATLPVGELIATVTAYPGAGASGSPVAEASAGLTIEPRTKTSLTFTMLGDFDLLEITPVNPTLSVNDALRLAAAPKNAAGEVVLVTPGSITWTSLNTSVVTVDAGGIATAIAPGIAEIRAAETESGISAAAQITVVPARWTVMVYMAADNNLEPYAIQDINELETAGSTSQVPVLVQVDRSPNYDSSNGNWTTTRRYYIKKDADTTNINSQLIADLGELDMAAPQTLADFVGWTTQTYPAEHYLLVLWDHGRGWRTRTLTIESLERPIKAILLDDTSHTEMTLGGLNQALAQGPRMDVVLFDACLMGMLEVAYSIMDCADIMVASEENVPAQGQSYSSVVQAMTANPDVSPDALSRMIVDEYMEHYTSGYSGTFTCSAINLASVDQAVAAADQLAQSILANMAAARSGVRTAQEQAQHYDYDKEDYVHYKDLYDFARLVNDLVGVPEVRSAAQAVMTAVDNMVIRERNSGGYVANSHGISIYLPNPGWMLSQYRTLSFAQNTQWDELLASY